MESGEVATGFLILAASGSPCAVARRAHTLTVNPAIASETSATRIPASRFFVEKDITCRSVLFYWCAWGPTPTLVAPALADSLSSRRPRALMREWIRPYLEMDRLAG